MLSSQNTTNYRIPLSPYAKVFYDEWLIEPQSYRYNMVCADHVLTGALDPQKLQSALKRYVADHLLLNSHIQLVGTTPYWCRNDAIDTLDGPEITPSHEALFDFVTHPFDLHQGPLYRFKLIQVSDHAHRLIIVLHHLVMDGISLNDGLFNTLSLYYNDPNYRIPLSLSEQIKQLSTFQDQCHTDLQAHQTALESFWKEQLMAVEPLDLRFLTRYQITEKDPSAPFENPIKEIRFELKNVQKQALQTIKAQYQISPYFFSQCLFALVLHRYTQQTDFAICYPISIQSGADFTFGGQVNLTLMPYRFTPDMQPCDLLKQVRTTLDAIKNHPIRSSYYLISDLIESNQSKPLLTGYFAQTLFRDALFNFENMTSVEALQGLSVDGVAPDRLLIENDPSRPNSYRLKYDSRTLDEGLIHRFIDCYQRVFQDVLEDLLEGTHKKIVDYPLLTQEQTKEILALGQGPAIKPASEQETLHKRFEEKAAQFPNHIALVCENRKLSYQALNEQANQLAHYLKDCYSIEPDDRVMLCLEKNEQLVIAILAVLKSSAAYVPVSGDYPDHRIAFLLKDVAPKCVILSQNYSAKFKDTTNLVVLDDQKTQQAWSKQSKDNPLKSAKGHHLAYIIYTSGTTGQPKGVMQQHNSIIDLFSGTDSIYRFNEHDVWTLFHAYVFDFSIWELFGALLYGGKLVIPTIQETRDNVLFYQLCLREKVTVLNQTPTLFYQFIPVAEKYKDDHYLSFLRYIILGGESLDYMMLPRWFAIYSPEKHRLFNMYGITETTVHHTYKEIKKTDYHVTGNGSCVGAALPGKNLYVLDQKQRPVPLGALGELYGSGGVARGYLNRRELSHRFIANPFEKTNKHGPLYRSGDLVRMRPNGNLDYMGRIDSQIKIHGYRIETGEIEKALKTYSGIAWALVMVHSELSNDDLQAENKHLVAYFIAKKPIDSQDLKEHVSQRLPAFMCPNVFIQTATLPMTINGKIDIDRLPKPCFQSKQPVLPNNESERIVCEAFCDILNRGQVSIDDSFFDLGGNSIKAIHLALVLNEHFTTQVSDIFTLRTPRNIAKDRLVHPSLFTTKLKQVTSYFKAKASFSDSSDTQRQIKKDSYLKEVKNIHLGSFSVRPIKAVLLTGATGYLGCNILYQLLNTTHYIIYLLIRASSQEDARSRLEHVFQFYFGVSISDYSSRIIYFCGDLGKDRLGLRGDDYKILVGTVDSIIHCAALVKHYGNKGQFYEANVKATQRLLQLSSLTRLKDFHYISTCSVAYFGRLALGETRLFTENDIIDVEQDYANLYNKTKFLGEQKVIESRQHGVKGSIYRVGSLTFMSDGSKVQENIEENAVASWLRFIMKIQCLCEEISSIQISQTDWVAKGIVLLFDKEQLANQTFHLFNPYPVELLKVFKNAKVSADRVSLSDFIESLLSYWTDKQNCLLLQMFLLHQGWVGHNNVFDRSSIHVLQNKTEVILNHLGFQWPRIHHSCMHRYLNKILSAKCNDQNAH